VEYRAKRTDKPWLKQKDRNIWDDLVKKGKERKICKRWL